MPLLLLGSLAAFLFLRVPIGVSLGLAGVLAYYVSDTTIVSLALSYYEGLDNFPFMAVPLFLLAGSLMEQGGISRRLIAVADCFVGNVTGGLSLVTILACMFFAAISGSGPSTTAAVGSIMIPTMIRRQYHRQFAAAVTASGGTLGILIPPSIAMIVYGISADQSVTRLFLAGFVPGIILGFMLMGTSYLICRARGYERSGAPFSGERALRTLWESRWAVLAPVVILGSIYGGFVTPTESAVVAVVYGYAVGAFVYRELGWRETARSLESASLITGVISIIWGTSLAFGELITIHGITDLVTQALSTFTRDPFLILMIISAILTFVGMWLNTMAQVIIFTPLFLPVANAVGIDPIHLGIIFVINCEVGFLTPPLGTSLFVGMSIADVGLGQAAKAALPFILTMLVAIVVLSLFPRISLFLPDLVLGRSP